MKSRVGSMFPLYTSTTYAISLNVKKLMPIGTMILNVLQLVFSPIKPNNAENCSMKKFMYLKYSNNPAPNTTPSTIRTFALCPLLAAFKP